MKCATLACVQPASIPEGTSLCKVCLFIFLFTSPSPRCFASRRLGCQTGAPWSSATPAFLNLLFYLHITLFLFTYLLLPQVLGHLEPGLPDGSESLLGTKGHPLEVAVGKADTLLAIRGGGGGITRSVTLFSALARASAACLRAHAQSSCH